MSGRLTAADVDVFNAIVDMSCTDCFEIVLVAPNRAWADDDWQWTDCFGTAKAPTLALLAEQVRAIRNAPDSKATL